MNYLSEMNMYFQENMNLLTHKVTEMLPGREVRKVILYTALLNKFRLLSIFLAGLLQSVMDAFALGLVYLAIQILSQFNSDLIVLSLPSFFPDSINSFSSDWRLFALGIVLLCTLVTQTCAAIARYFSVLNSEVFAARSKVEVIKKIHSQFFMNDYIDSSKMKIGDFYQLTNDSANSIQQAVLEVSSLVENSFNAIAYIIVLVAISPILIVVIGVALGVVAFAQLKPSSAIKKAFRETIAINSSINQTLSDDYRSLKLIKSMNLESSANALLSKSLDVLILRSRKQAVLAQQTEAFNKVFSIFLVCLMLMISAFIISGEVNIIPVLTAFIIALQKLNGSTSNISRSLTSLNASAGKLGLLENFLSCSQNINTWNLISATNTDYIKLMNSLTRICTL